MFTFSRPAPIAGHGSAPPPAVAQVGTRQGDVPQPRLRRRTPWQWYVVRARIWKECPLATPCPAIDAGCLVECGVPSLESWHLKGRSPIAVGGRPELFSPSALREARASAESRGWEGGPPARTQLPRYVRAPHLLLACCAENGRTARGDSHRPRHASVPRAGQAMSGSLSYADKGHVASQRQRSAAHPKVRSPLVLHIPAQHTCGRALLRLLGLCVLSPSKAVAFQPCPWYRSRCGYALGAISRSYPWSLPFRPSVHLRYGETRPVGCACRVSPAV